MGLFNSGSDVKITVNADASQAKGELNSLHGSATDTFSKLTGLAKKFGVAFLAYFAVSKVVSGLKDITAGAMESEDAATKLASSMKSAGVYTDSAYKAALDYSSQLQLQSTYTDEAIQGAQSLLSSLSGLTGDGLNQATLATANLAAGLGIDLHSAAMLVSKSISGNTTSLKLHGVEIRQGTSDGEKFIYALEGIESKFGGRAAAELTTYSGKINQVGKQWGEFKDKLGLLFIPIVSVAIRLCGTLLEILHNIFSTERITKWSDALRRGLNLLTGNTVPDFERKIENLNTILTRQKTLVEMVEQKLQDTFNPGLLLIYNAQLLHYNKGIEETSKKIAALKTELDKIQPLPDEPLVPPPTPKDLQAWEDFNQKLEQQGVAFKLTADMARGFQDALAEGFKTGNFGQALKNFVMGELIVWAAAETAKTWMVAASMAIPTFGASIAAGAAQTAVIATQFAVAKGAIDAVTFAEGGIVPGNKPFGDQISARVNSGEMVLNKEQQTNLLKIINTGTSSNTQPINIIINGGIFTMDKIQLNQLAKLIDSELLVLKRLNQRVS